MICINLWKYLTRISWTKIIILWIIVVTTGSISAQSEKATNHSLLDEIPTEFIVTDSVAQAMKTQELENLTAGDTIRAFTNYVQWMAFHIDRSNRRLWGTEYEPYILFAQRHEGLREHYIYKFYLGLNQNAQGAQREAVRQLLDAENDIATYHPELLETLYFELYNSLLNLTDYQGAAEYALKTLELNQKKGDKKGELSARLLMATSFAKQHRYEETNRQRNQAAELARETGEYGQLIFIYANNAIDARKQNNYEASFQFYNDALTTIDTNTTFNVPNLQYFRAFVHANKLTLYNDAGMPDSTIQRGPRYIDSLQGYGATQSIIDAQIQIGRAYLIQGKPRQARAYLEQARDSLEGTGFEELTTDVNRYLSEVYQATGDYQKATHALSVQIRVRNEMDSLNNEQLINSLQMRYESDRQQEVIEEKEIQVQQEIQQRKANMRIFTASMIGIALIGFSVFQWKHRNQLKREKDIEIKYTQKLIQFQEDENLRISKELHDGIGQSLMLIKNKVQLNNDDATAQMVGDTLNEIRTISRALHPFTLQKLGLTAALQKLIDDFDANTDILVDTSIEEINDHFTDKSALNIFRIAQETLSNIMKHSQAKAVEFTVRKHPKYAELSVKDNGRGFDVTENFNTVSSLGLKTLRERTRFLKGQLNIHSEKGVGTEVTFKVPYDV